MWLRPLLDDCAEGSYEDANSEPVFHGFLMWVRRFCMRASGVAGMAWSHYSGEWRMFSSIVILVDGALRRRGVPGSIAMFQVA